MKKTSIHSFIHSASVSFRHLLYHLGNPSSFSSKHAKCNYLNSRLIVRHYYYYNKSSHHHQLPKWWETKLFIFISFDDDDEGEWNEITGAKTTKITAKKTGVHCFFTITNNWCWWTMIIHSLVVLACKKKISNNGYCNMLTMLVEIKWLIPLMMIFVLFKYWSFSYSSLCMDKKIK